MDYPPCPVGLSAVAGLGESEVWQSCLRRRTGRYFPTPLSSPCLLPSPPDPPGPRATAGPRPSPQPGPAGAFRALPGVFFRTLLGEAYYPPPGTGLAGPGEAGWRRWRLGILRRVAEYEDAPPPRRRTRTPWARAPKVWSFALPHGPLFIFSSLYALLCLKFRRGKASSHTSGF